MLTYAQKERFESTPIERIDGEAASRDVGVLMFGFLALAALLVSMPATYVVMSRYHSHDEIGTMQAVASLVVFEAGAIVSKLATLLFPWWRGRLTTLQIALLAFVAGANALATTAAAPQGETIQAVLFAGLLPFFQALFLGLTVARIKALHMARLEAQETRQPSQAERLAATLAEAQERAFKAMLEQVTERMSVTVLPQPVLPSPTKAIGFTSATQQKAMPQNEAPQSHNEAITQHEAIDETWSCPNCKANLATYGHYLSAKRWGYCASCKTMQ